MASLKFVLSKSQHQRKIKSKESMLMLRYIHKKEVTYFTAHKNIDEKYWDDKSQQIKRSYSGSDRFNIYIRTVRQKVEDIVNGLLIKGEDPSKDYVKRLYTSGTESQEKKRQYSFFEFAEVYLEDSKKRKTEGTIKGYRTTLNQLKKYEIYSKVKLDWQNIDMTFYYDFLDYYTGIQGLTNNGFGKVIKIIKVILNEATEKGYNSNRTYQHKKFKTIKEEVNNIYLSDDEIQKLINLDLKNNSSLERVRDLFIFGCYTGLRFSDFSQVKSEHIVDNKLRIKTIKTDEWVTIPLLNEVKDIMEKYKESPNSLPKSCVNQTMNRYLKELGELAKIEDKVLKIRNKGKERVEETFYKWQLICTHTARRSFATNMFKRGVPTRVIMKITGHRTEKAFSSYIKISQEENADLMLEYLNKSA